MHIYYTHISVHVLNTYTSSNLSLLPFYKREKPRERDSGSCPKPSRRSLTSSAVRTAAHGTLSILSSCSSQLMARLPNSRFEHGWEQWGFACRIGRSLGTAHNSPPAPPYPPHAPKPTLWWPETLTVPNLHQPESHLLLFPHAMNHPENALPSPFHISKPHWSSPAGLTSPLAPAHMDLSFPEPMISWAQPCTAWFLP